MLYRQLLVVFNTYVCNYAMRPYVLAIIVMINESEILFKLLEHQSMWIRIKKIKLNRNC